MYRAQREASGFADSKSRFRVAASPAFWVTTARKNQNREIVLGGVLCLFRSRGPRNKHNDGIDALVEDPMSDNTWEVQKKNAQRQIEPIHFLLGDWIGSGVCEGSPVSGRLTARLLVDGSWIEAIEELVDANGDVLHQDITFYRFDSQNECIEATQISEGAHRMISSVELMDGGFRWITGPGAPQLRFWMLPEGLRYRVTRASEEVAAVEMVYQRP